jgi:hypothetical protein
MYAVHTVTPVVDLGNKMTSGIPGRESGKIVGAGFICGA